MSLLNQMEILGKEELSVPAKPLDPEILGGFAIYGSMSSDQLDMAAMRLNEAFAGLRAMAAHPAADRKKDPEFGACVAYAVPLLQSGETDLVDSILRQTSRQQNHGMQTIKRRESHPKEVVTELWRGYESSLKYTFILYKKISTLVLDNYQQAESSIWALKTRKGYLEPQPLPQQKLKQPETS